MGCNGAVGKKRERKMQKLWFGLFGLIITTGAFAADLCVRNDAMVVAMNPLVKGGTNAVYDRLNKTWSIQFGYGTISGIAACANDCATTGCVATNQNLNIYNTTGNYCYCKMLRPALSSWVFSGYGSGCADCEYQCPRFANEKLEMRRGLFRSVNMLD